MKVNNNTGCIGKGWILLIFLCIWLVTPMQVRLLLLKRGKTIQDIKNDFHQYSLCELAVEEKSLRDVKDLEQVYGKIKVIDEDQTIHLILRISKNSTSFLQRPESCYIFFNQNEKVVGYHYELED